MSENINWDNIEESLLKKKFKRYFNSTEDIEQSFDDITNVYDHNGDWLTMINYTYSKLRYFESKGLQAMNFRNTFDSCLFKFRQHIDVSDLAKIKNIITLDEARSVIKHRDPRYNDFVVDMDFIRDKMNYMGVSKAELPEMIGMDLKDPARSLRNNNRGKTGAINLNAFMKIAYFLDAKPEDLIQVNYKG